MQSVMGAYMGTEQEDVHQMQERSKARRATCSLVSSSPTMFRARASASEEESTSGMAIPNRQAAAKVGSAGILARSGTPSTH